MRKSFFAASLVLFAVSCPAARPQGAAPSAPSQQQTAASNPRRQGRGQPDPKRVALFKMAVNGRLSPVIINRQPSLLDQQVLNTLRQQKQAAQIQGSHTMGATPGQANSQDPASGQSTPPGGSASTPGGSGNSSGAGITPAGNPPTGANGPGTTGGSTSSSGSNNPPSMAGPARRPLTARTALAPVGITPPPAATPPPPAPHSSLGVRASNQFSLGCPVNSNQVMIQSVSGQESGSAIFTQDPQFNPFTITGCRFGNAQGQAHLNDASGRKLADLVIDSWTDTMLKVEVDPKMLPSNDLTNVTLVVNPTNGPQGQRQGFKFHGMRKKVLLQSLPPTGVLPINQGGFVTHGAAVLSLTMPMEVDGYRVGAEFSSPYRGIASSVATEEQLNISEVLSYGNDGQGMTAGVDRNSSGHGYPNGTDTWQIKSLAPGFSVDSFQIKTWNASFCTTGFPIADTQTHEYGSWNASLQGDTITVQWKSVYCEGNNGGFNGTNSSYGLNIWVIGPAGIDPLTGQPSQQ